MEDRSWWVGSRWQAHFEGRGGELLEQELKREGLDSAGGEEKHKARCCTGHRHGDSCQPGPQGSREKAECLLDDSPVWTQTLNKYLLSIYPVSHTDVTQSDRRPGNRAEGCKSGAKVTYA